MQDHTTESLSRARELRRQMTYPERRLWSVLRDREISCWKWRRQHPKGIYILDFFCHEAGLVVEVDGDSHAGQEEYDANRTEWLEEQGLRVIRFTNDDVLKNLDGVMEEILRVCQERCPHPGLLPKGEGGMQQIVALSRRGKEECNRSLLSPEGGRRNATDRCSLPKGEGGTQQIVALS
ncbi:endonuclease domain-containing protein [Leptolinea tardivitalis]|uniref:endonuclease domain-containing protein n=1 Tax=Leptolinea tardivitalis TaxID=229920 RepID=UPI0009E8C25E|nr:DUF559 domain-containing protein [Leptolinea tardivitalis]